MNPERRGPQTKKYTSSATIRAAMAPRENVKKSVKKKLKEKGFAAQVNREQILRCEPLLGIPLDEFIAITLQAMQKIAPEIGL